MAAMGLLEDSIRLRQCVDDLYVSKELSGSDVGSVREQYTSYMSTKDKNLFSGLNESFQKAFGFLHSFEESKPIPESEVDGLYSCLDEVRLHIAAICLYAKACNLENDTELASCIAPFYHFYLPR